MNVRTQRTRNEIRKALLACMQEKPVSDIFVTDIASRAGIDRTTFYRHFKSVDEAVHDLERNQLEDFRVLMTEKDLFGEELIRVVLEQIEKGNAINKTAMVSYFSGKFIEEMAAVAREYAFDAWRQRMPKATDSEVDLALSTVIAAAILAVKRADEYGREAIVSYIGKMIHGIVKMYE